MKRISEYRVLHGYHAKEILYLDCVTCKQIDKRLFPHHSHLGRHNHQGKVNYMDLKLDLMAKELLRNALDYQNFRVNHLNNVYVIIELL